MGIGDPSQPPPYNVDKAKLNDRYHLYWQDTWRMHRRLTLNYGLAWSFESTLVNHDLDKPKYLAPVLGADGTRATDHDYNNFSPSLGLAWNLSDDNKTVIRAGAGLYYDTRLLWQRLEERAYIGPAGNGRVLVSGASVPNPLPNVPGVAQGAPLDFRTAPTAFTLGNLVSILPAIRAGAEASLAALRSNDLSIRGVQVAKQATNLIPAYYPASYSEHMNVGVQRDLGHNMVLSTDFVFRQFMHFEIGSLDYNRFFRVGGPIIPRCAGAQAADPAAQCSTGPISVRTPVGRANYKGLLAKLDKRFSNRFQFTASYAFSARQGINGVADLDNWFSTWGPQGAHHTLTASGLIDLPWKFQLTFITSHSSVGPVMPTISVIDLNGDGSSGEPLPGACHNCFNRGLGKSDLARLVDQFNQQYAGTTTPRGQRVPTLALPANYTLGEGFASTDFRLTKIVPIGERLKFNIFGEVFNAFNVANLTGYSFDLTNPSAFGRPTGRFGQVFGSGGPRAFQLGGRASF